MSIQGPDSGLKLLQTIVGEKLSAVVFIEDDVQLQFNGATLTAYTLPTVSTDNQTLHWGEPHYRDELRRQIGHVVTSVNIQDGEFIEVVFDDHVKVQISLRDRDYRGPEAAEFYSVSKDWLVI